MAQCRVSLFHPQTLEILEQRRAEFGRRRDLLPACVTGVRIAVEPEGAVWHAISARSAAMPSRFASSSETGHVAFTPGLDFGRFTRQGTMCVLLHAKP